jgi:hypothetical protein
VNKGKERKDTMPRMDKIGKGNTTISTAYGITSVVFHETPIVMFTNKYIQLDSGGWQTNTTKVRMNQASNQFDLGFYVYQEDYTWYVNFKGETFEFSDGMNLFR